MPPSAADIAALAKSPLALRLKSGQSAAMADGSLESDTTPQPRVFATTHWSVVLAAGGADTPQSSAALERLCRTYWYPLYAHIRRRGYSEEEAKDLTQELFQRLLERQFLCGRIVRHEPWPDHRREHGKADDAGTSVSHWYRIRGSRTT